jgi:phosphate starvation-inducible PhoH-like protein
MVVTGDVTQIDLPSGKNSGLREAAQILNQVPGIGMITFDEKDVVRHEIVASIIKAYEKYEQARGKGQGAKR